LKIFYTDHYILPLPPWHRFPMEKYRLLRERVQAEGVAGKHGLQQPPAATDEEILRAHDRGYLERVTTGTLAAEEQRRIGFPWSPEMVERSCRSSGATLAAARAALEEGSGVNLAGGTHHAFRDRGEGYCVFNDSAIAALALQAEGRARRVVILDCDVHQGNGTAAILAGDPTVFTFSIHAANNYPFEKEASDLDIALPDGTGDRDYLEALEKGVCRALSAAQADLAIYLAGADPFEATASGASSSPRAGSPSATAWSSTCAVPPACRWRSPWLAVCARRIEDCADIHFTTVRTAADYAR
jgi:acetoin utilization deacetylase AcuC-like enzyme